MTADIWLSRVHCHHISLLHSGFLLPFLFLSRFLTPHNFPRSAPTIPRMFWCGPNTQLSNQILDPGNRSRLNRGGPRFSCATTSSREGGLRAENSNGTGWSPTRQSLFGFFGMPIRHEFGLGHSLHRVLRFPLRFPWKHEGAEAW